MAAFPSQQFRAIFSAPSNTVKQSLKPFVAQFKKYNMEWIFEACEIIVECQNSDNKHLLLVNYNSIVIVKALMETCDYMLVNMVQTYFVPRLLEIASYELQVLDHKIRGKSFFVDKGFKQAPETLNYGIKYVRNAHELLVVGARMKPKKLFGSNDTPSPSDFTLAINELTSKGWKPFEQLLCFKEENIAAMVSAYRQVLKHLDSTCESYSQAFQMYFEKQLYSNFESVRYIDPRRLLASGEIYLTECTFLLIREIFKPEAYNLEQLQAGLDLLHDFFRWGDIEAFQVVNREAMLDPLLKEVQRYPQERGLARGRLILPTLKGSEKDKEKFYISLLKYLQLWAACFPNKITSKQPPSRINFLYDLLAHTYQLQFPKEDPQNSFTIESKESFRHNSYRSNELLKQFEYSDPVNVDIFAKKPTSGKPVSKKAMPESSLKQQSYKQQSLEQQPEKQQSKKPSSLKPQPQKPQSLKPQQPKKQFEKQEQKSQKLVSEMNKKEGKNENVLKISPQPNGQPISMFGELNEVSKNFNLLHQGTMSFKNQQKQAKCSIIEEQREHNSSAKPNNIKSPSPKQTGTEKEFEVSNPLKLNGQDSLTVERQEAINRSKIPSLANLVKQSTNRIASQHQDEEAVRILDEIPKKGFQEAPISEVNIKKYQKSPVQHIGSQFEGTPLKFPKSIDAMQSSFQQKSPFSVNKHSVSKVEPIPSQSHSDYGSNQESPIKKVSFLRSELSDNHEAEGQEDLIGIPEGRPLEESFHELSLTSSKDPSPSFKRCFESDKFILSRDRHKRLFELENDASLLRAVPYGKPKQSKINVPSILQEHNRRFEEQLRIVESQKNKKIGQLQSRLVALQKEEKYLKQTIQHQNQEIKSIKEQSVADMSVVGKAKQHYYEDQDYLFKNKMTSTMKEPGSNWKSLQGSFVKEPIVSPTGQLISLRPYMECLQQIKTEQQKKGLLRSKQLMYKDESIEFGCMSRRQESSLVITIFITPSSDLLSVTYEIEQLPQLAVVFKPITFGSIPRNKQEKLLITVRINNTPYRLPTIQFRYTLGNSTTSKKFILPCPFHKFFEVNRVDEGLVDRVFSKLGVVRGEQVPYSKRLLKSFDLLKDYLPNICAYSDGKPNRAGEIVYCGLASFGKLQFYLRVAIKPNYFLYLQSAGEWSIEEAQMVHFYICLLTHLFMKNFAP